MKAARLAVLGVALAAGAGAAFIAKGAKPPQMTVVQAPAPVLTDKVLVAAKELSFGDALDDTGMRWEDWPKDKIPETFVRKSALPGGIEELKGAIVRADFAAGVPLRRDLLDMGAHSGFLAMKLAPGKRAVSINIDTQGSSTAGGFILPGARVDVIHIFKDEDAARRGNGNAFVSETILTDVRVLAIGPNVELKNGERVVNGSNATLELTPSQVETLTLAQRVGLLSLALRALRDANAASEQHQDGNHRLLVVRNGMAMKERVR